MDATTWYLISIVGYSLAGVLLIVVIFMFFKMNIPAIIGDLNGKTAARQIQEIREQNQRTGNKQHRPSTFNVGRGTLTTPVSSRFGITGKAGNTLSTMSAESKMYSDSTEVLMAETEVLEIGTEVLMNENEIFDIGAEVLMNETEVLDVGTVVLSQDSGTTVLHATGDLDRENVTEPLAIEFKIVKDIKITHTNEII